MMYCTHCDSARIADEKVGRRGARREQGLGDQDPSLDDSCGELSEYAAAVRRCQVIARTRLACLVAAQHAGTRQR